VIPDLGAAPGARARTARVDTHGRTYQIRRPAWRPALRRGAAALALLLAAGAPAQPTPQQLERLGGDLTPVGAERAGNADGSIPPWTGGLPATPIDARSGYVDPYAQDQPLATITAANVEQYRQWLAPGHLAMFAAYPDSWRMEVYPTRRSASWPQPVLDEVRRQAPLARTAGDRLLDVGRSAVPFPIPADGLQVMWNHVLRWRGGSVRRQYAWFPVNERGRYFTVRLIEEMVFDQQGYMREPRPNRLLNVRGFYLAPAGIEGQMRLLWEPIDPVAETRVTWDYDTRWRRVDRVPSLAYDALDPRTQGMRTVDQYDGWNGAPDRYDWKLLGKRELLIQYNSYKLADRSLKYADILQPGHLKPGLLRYEKHRVWVVEATLRPGAHHRYARRTFYVDEDTWQVALEEAYRGDGRLWRFGDHAAMQFYDVQVPWYRATVVHDLIARSYLAAHLDNEEPGPWRWGFTGELADFLPSTLRMLGTN
jgi:hypothetical protein